MKKLFLVMVAVVLCAAFVAGCAAPAETTAEGSAAATESAQASESAEPAASESADAAASEAALPEGDYMSWTAEEWNAASDAEKTAASETLLLDIGDAMMDGYSEMVEMAKTDEDVKAQLDEQIESLKAQIDTFLNGTSDATIGDLAEASKQAIG